jgi:hypothetical protein
MRALERSIVGLSMPRSPVLRAVYLTPCICISAFALGSFVELVAPYVAVRYDYWSEVVLVTAQVGFQWLFMIRSSWEERVRYMFIALTVSMVGALMLLPLLLYNNLAPVSVGSATAYFFMVVGIIFVVHHRLIVRNSLPKILSYTWVLYRLLLLLFVATPR